MPRIKSGAFNTVPTPFRLSVPTTPNRRISRPLLRPLNYPESATTGAVSCSDHRRSFHNPRLTYTSDWTLLSTTDLRFIYLDPVLQFHLEEQASELINRSLLEFIHPDEQATAWDDLGQVIGSKNFHGSITRSVFCRPNASSFSNCFQNSFLSSVPCPPHVGV